MSIDQILHQVITGWGNLEQIQFLKILPAFKFRDDVVTTWCAIYDEVASLLSQEQIKKPFFKKKLKNLQMKKRTVVNFIEKAVIGKYISLTDSEFEEISVILKKQVVDANYIDVVKFYKNIVRLPKTVQPTVNNVICHFDEISATEIARCMTAGMSEIISDINTKEFVLTAMAEETDPTTCPTLYHALKEFQKYGYWVPTEVLFNATTKEQQIESVKKFVDIAIELKNLNNYHLLFAVVGGLNNRAIQRLKYLWDENSEHQQKLYLLETVVSHTFSYKRYRTLVKKVKDKSVVPYTGIIIKDIKQLLEGPTFTEKGFNWHIYNSVNQILITFDRFTKYYTMTPNPRTRHYLDNLAPCMNDDQLYVQSNLYKMGKGSLIASPSLNLFNREEARPRSVSYSLQKNRSTPSILPEKVTPVHPRSISISFSGKNTIGMEQWSMTQVVTWLDSVGLSEYREIFQNQAITGFSLVELDEEILLKLGINKMGDRIKLLKLVQLSK